MLLRLKTVKLLVASLAITFTAITNADTINVPGDQPTIQAGINVANNGDEVVVAAGTYVENLNLLGKAISLRSESGAQKTIIDGDLQRSVIRCNNSEGSDTVIDGFTLRNGIGEFVSNDRYGGGIYIFASSPTIRNCVISGNTAFGEFGRGGGIYIELGSPVISDCNFVANTAEYRAGGIFCFDGSMTATNCTFEGNSTPIIFQSGGGAIFSRDSQVNLVDCNFHDNEGYHGGAIGFVQFFGEGASITLTNCLITDNFADVGGGLLIQEAAALLINSTLITNQASGDFGFGGGIVLLSNSTMLLTNTTFSANSAIEGGGISVIGSSAIVKNSILWGDSPNEISAEVGVTVRFSDVQNGWAGAGNIDADPLFVDPDSNDYHISPDSPCIDAGRNSVVPKNITEDFDGNPRFVEDPKTPDTGLGDCPMVDMGSYEFQDGSLDCCLWDLDGSGSVGTGDLLALFSQWGTDGSADFDGSGAVGTGDLLILFANWGPCP